MAPSSPLPLQLYAVVPAAELSRLRPRYGVSPLVCGPVAALYGRRPDCGDEVRAALWHDGVVGLACATFSAVVPFRLGVELGSEAELRAVIGQNARALSAQLERFRDRVEMGLKVRLGRADAEPSFHLPFRLDRVRGLAPRPADRSERLGASAQGRIFEGCYLIARSAIEEFWRAVEGIRRAAPELALLGSGPWAAYSFCDVPLKRGLAPVRSVLAAGGRADGRTGGGPVRS
jgi:gas vesicle protein GvpL/GvpF